MDFTWVDLANPVTWWWLFLVGVGVVNIGLCVATIARLRTANGLSWVAWLCGIYVLVCAFRSFLPRADVQRICLFDTWFSSVLVGRSVATLGELCFVLQGALVLRAVATAWEDPLAIQISTWMVPTIAVAECCSWYAVITTNYVGNTCEESLWAITYTLAGVALWSLWRRGKGTAKVLLGAGAVACMLYVSFMVLVDVPMYFGRWRQDLAEGRAFLGLMDGFHDLNTRWVVTHMIDDWRTEIPWMSLYFSVAVWISVALCHVPLSRERLVSSRGT